MLAYVIVTPVLVFVFAYDLTRNMRAMAHVLLWPIFLAIFLPLLAWYWFLEDQESWEHNNALPEI